MTAGARQALSITLPWPDKALSPNAGKRSMYPAIRARKAYREDARKLWKSELVKAQRRPCAACGHSKRSHYQGAADCTGCVCDGYRGTGFVVPPVVADITFTYTRKRRFDEDNHIAMLKPVWDGAQDAGVIVGDSHDVFSIGEVAFVKGTERQVTVTIRSKEAT